MIRAILIASVLFLAGCGAMQETKVVTKIEYRVADIPQALLTECVVTEPPNRETFLRSSTREQNQILVRFSIRLMENIEDCDIKNQEIRSLIEKHRTRIQEQNHVGSGSKP